jgi:hypothetical protein
MELADQVQQMEISRRAVAEMKAGLGRPAEEMLAEMRKILSSIVEAAPSVVAAFFVFSTYTSFLADQEVDP